MHVRHLAARVDGATAPRAPATHPTTPAHGPGSFAETLERLTRARAPALALSAHAAERIAERGIRLTDDDRAALAEAVGLLERKGAREALLLRQDAAFVVSVPNRTVVTALGRDDLRERVFTGIDSALLL